MSLIRDRLYKADKAILLATPLSEMNPAIPLDYGLNGTFQHTSKVAVFPVTQDPQRWKDKCYFESYGFIQKKYSCFNYPDDWQVVFPEGDRIPLREWLVV